jgi:NDP-sugar pyrophosphorylase family protein
MAFFGDGAKWNVRIDYSREDKPLSTIGPLKLIEDLPDNFLVMNGDVLTNLNYRDLYQSHVDSGADATVGAYQRNVKIDFGVLEHDRESHKITRFIEKPTEHFTVSMGVYAFSRRILGMVPDNEPYGFDQLMLDCIAQERDARAYPFDGYWLDIGRPDDYDTANATFDQLREVLLPPTVDDGGSGNSS